MGWVLSDTDAALRVLSDTEPEVSNPEYMVASLEAYMSSLTDSSDDKPIGPLSLWSQALKGALDDAQWQGNDVDDIISEMKNLKALHYEPPDPLYPGAPVLALLTEDKEWHPAILEHIEEHPDSRQFSYHVQFTEYGKPQICEKEHVVAMTDVPDDGEEDMGIGECELCQRTMRITFHHLIPKETHRRYIKKKKLPANFTLNDVVRSAKGTVIDPADKDFDTEVVEGNLGLAILTVKCTSDFLGSYGASLCRACHSFIHSVVGTNAELAAHWNTVALLRSHEKVAVWIQYVSKQKITQKRYKKVIRKR